MWLWGIYAYDIWAHVFCMLCVLFDHPSLNSFQIWYLVAYKFYWSLCLGAREITQSTCFQMIWHFFSEHTLVLTQLIVTPFSRQWKTLFWTSWYPRACDIHKHMHTHRPIHINYLKENDQGVRCEIMFPSSIRNYMHKVSGTWLPNHEHSKVPTIIQSYTKNYMHLRKTLSGRGGLL